MKFIYSNFLLVYFAVLILGGIANAQNTNQQSNVNALTIQNIQPENQSVNNDVSLLKAQNDLLRQHNQELMTTVQWTINTFIEIIIGVVVVVIGLGWYTNFRAYDKDYKNLVRDMNTELASVRGLIKNYEKMSKEIIELEFSKFQFEMNTKYYDWQSKASQKQHDWIKDTYKIVDEAIDHKMFSVDILMSDVNYKFAVIQSEQSLKKDSIEDALSVYAEAIAKEQGFKNQFKTHEMLLKIESILESNEKVLSNYIIKNIKRNLDGVSDKFKYEVEHIKELMQVKKSEITSSQNSETDTDSQ